MTLFSQAGSLNYASHTQPPGSDLEKKMNATCGPKCLESYGRFNRNGLWAKTFSALLIGQEGWYSKRCKLTWKVKGTKYNRMYFQLRVSTLPTNEIGFGLWLSTPRAAETPRSERFAKGRTLSPSEYAQKMGLLKTPTAMDGEVTSGKKNPVSGNSGTLAQEIMSDYKPTMEKLGLLPTPTTQDARIGENNIGGSKHRMERGSVALADIAFGFNNKMLPTPNCMDTLPPKEGAAMERIANGARKGRTAPSNLREYVNPKSWEAYQMIPTPQARDWKGCEGRRGDIPSYVQDTMGMGDGKPSQLNPRFVAEMMGFPPNWLELPFQNTETNP
jgi:hypothetical protein